MEDIILDTEEVQEEVQKSSQQLKNELWKAITDANEECDNAIISDMKWKGYNVWLSSENQFNFKAIYDLMVQGVDILPQTFKFGEEFYTFETKEDLSQFYLASIQHIHKCLDYCWKKKKAIETEYTGLIAEAEQREAETQDNE